VLEAAWREQARQIYADYTIYHQAQGAEQNVFDTHTGQPSTRSTRLVERWRTEMALPVRGRLMDIGCGNGALLRAFSTALPGWSLAGVEVNDHYQSVVESIPRVERLFTCPAMEVPGEFDAITLLHALEHIPSPRQVLIGLRPRLAAAGLLLIQVPDCKQNPFMFLVADHASHFFVAALRELVQSAGYEVLVAANDWVAKEITIVARKSTTTPCPMAATSDVVPEISRKLDWLVAFVREARAVAVKGPLGIFGTSIAATWLQDELDGRAEFFVDEDPNRLGQIFMDRKILSPGEAPAGSRVLVALPTPMAEQVRVRLSSRFPHVEFCLTPAAPAC
jgi:2-polyprenyl-3-methyl-5-hydroxy-6-metoxy-1,4-benzoquinol methylase